MEGRIAAIGRVQPNASVREIDVSGCAVMPGLVMAHVHLCQTLMRGLADDMPLLEWLRRRIWPLEAAHDQASLDTSARLGLAEMLLAGTTAVLDHGSVHDYEIVLAAAVEAGIRITGGKALMDRGTGAPRRLRETSSAALGSAEALEACWARHESGRIRYAWVPRFVLSCSERLIRGAVERASATGALVHTHAAEHPGEKATVARLLGSTDVALLRRWGVRGPRASLAHGVQLERRELAWLAKDGTRIVHCPTANLKLGSGIAPVASLIQVGVGVALGADGAACNNNLDPWLELRHTALLSGIRAAPGAVGARQVLRMATIEGARTLGQEARFGSIEPGKCADLIVVRLDGMHTLPALDPASALVYAAQSRDVRDVFIDGIRVVQSGQLLTLDEERLRGVAPEQARRLKARAKV